MTTRLHVSIDPVAFLRGWLGSTQRYLKIAGALDELGWDAAVVAGRDRHHVAEAVEKAYPGEVFRTTFSTVPALLDRHGLRYALGLWRRLSSSPGGEDLWSARIGDWTGRHFLKTPLASVDVLCGVSYANWGVLGATRALSKRAGAPYWLDVRDPLWGTAGRGRADISGDDRMCLTDATSIVTTTASYAQYLRETFPEVADRVTCVRSPYCPWLVEITDAAQHDDKVMLCYGGYLHGLPALSAIPLLDAMSGLIHQTPSARGRVTLRLIGTGPGMREAESHANRLGLAENLECLPPADPRSLSQRLSEADVLCLFMPSIEDYAYRVPGKLAEYLFSAKPILAVTPPGETADTVDKTGSGFVAHPSETERLAAILSLLLEQKAATGTVAMERDPQKLEPYSSDTFRANLGDILAACAD